MKVYIMGLGYNYLMAQNNYIRPLNRNYRDFTQRQFEETFDETPYKFRQKIQDNYVKKPKREVIVHPPPQPFVMPPQPKSEPPCNCSCFSSLCPTKPKIEDPSHPDANRNLSCWQKMCGCCSQKKNSVEPHEEHGSFLSNTFCCFRPSTSSTPKKADNCCCRCFEPQLCSPCIQKLCPSCSKGLCLKFRLCENCQNMLCPSCRKAVGSGCCDSRPKLRDYPIRFKNRGNLHFVSCLCPDCVKRTEESRMMQANQQVQPNMHVNMDQHMDPHFDPHMDPHMNPNINPQPHPNMPPPQQLNQSNQLHPSQGYHIIYEKLAQPMMKMGSHNSFESYQNVESVVHH